MLLPQAAGFASRFWRLPADASAHGPALDRHLLLNLWVFTAILCLAHIILFAGALLRRRRTPPRRPPVYAHLPLLALAVLFSALAFRAHRLWADERYTGTAPEAMQVEAVGQQFAWYFRYPGADATFGRTRPTLVDPSEGNPLGIDPTDQAAHDDFVSSTLVLPVDREVDLRLRALDVIHGFAIPELRVKQNALPGQTLHIHFTPTVPGTYAILCTQLCGLGHFRMAATLRVVPPAEYATWLAAHQQASPRAGTP